MKKIILCVLGLLLLFSSLCAAQMSLSLPAGYEALTCNGKKPEMFNRVAINRGINQLVFRFAGELGRTNDADMFYSDVFVVLFRGDENLRLAVPEINNEFELKDLNEKQQVDILDKNGKSKVVAKDKLIKEGFLLARDFEQEIMKFNQGSSAAALKPTVVNSSMSTSAPANISTSQVPGMALKILQYWYLNATEQERAEFKQWLKQQ